MKETKEVIFLEEGDYNVDPSGEVEGCTVPRILVKKGESWVKHVRCEGARFHVLSYSLTGKGAVAHCSEPDCIVNKTNSVIQQMD